MKHILLIVCAVFFISVAYSAEEAPVGHYLLISDDGNLHAQPCTISKKEDILYLTIDKTDFFPQTSSLQLFPLPNKDGGYRVIITPNLISKNADHDIDTCTITLKPMKSGLYGDYSATRTSIDSSFKGKLLLYPIQP